MKIKLKFPRKIKGLLYSPGVYEMPESVKKDWYFEALLKSGDLSIVEEEKSLGEVKHFDPEPSRAAKVETINASEKPEYEMKDRSTLQPEEVVAEAEDAPKKSVKKAKGK